MTDEKQPEDELEPIEDAPELEPSPPAAAQASGAQHQVAPTQAKSRAAGAEDELPYIDDRVSKVWVLAIVGVFLLILAYGLLFGKAGMFVPATPSPSPSPTASPTLSISPTPRTSPSSSPSISSSPSTSGSPAVTPTPAPSASATPAPTPSTTAAPSST